MLECFQIFILTDGHIFNTDTTVQLVKDHAKTARYISMAYTVLYNYREKDISDIFWPKVIMLTPFHTKGVVCNCSTRRP